MKTATNRISGVLGFIVGLSFLNVYGAAQDASSVAIEAVKQVTPQCEKCVFFAVPHENSLIKKHQLFFVSTVDRLPSPMWTVAVAPKSKQPYLLGPKELTSWNKVIREEKLKLQTDSEMESLAKAFLELAVGSTIFIDQLLPAELERIEKETHVKPNSKLQVVKNGNIFSVSFYGKDVRGALQAWDLTVEPAGTILKADVREF